MMSYHDDDDHHYRHDHHIIFNEDLYNFVLRIKSFINDLQDDDKGTYRPSTTKYNEFFELQLWH